VNTENLLQEMSKGVVTIVFEKIDTGEIRTMPCSTNKELTGKTTVNQDPHSDTFVTYALDKNDWRDVRVNTIKDWYVGHPK
jgi:hypothetical protein